MRGTSDQQTENLVALAPEDLILHEHPIGRIKPLADRVAMVAPAAPCARACGGRSGVRRQGMFESCDGTPRQAAALAG